MEKPVVVDGVYRLTERIAEGGMAVVYRADVDLDAFDYTRLYAYTQVQGRTHAQRQQEAIRLASTLAGEALDRRTVRAILKAHDIPLPPEVVAIKVAKAEASAERFEAEWQNLLFLNHQNVIKVYGGGSWMGRHYYAMELLEDLVPAETIAGFALAEKLKILIQAGRGLAFLHDNGLVHRDVKPDNFLTRRSERGELATSITDLGIAKLADGSPALTQASSFMGTPYYMAPEQVFSAHEVDARADVYALGASLYDMVLGVPPFNDKTTIFEIVSCISRGERPTPPKQINPGLPDVLDSIIRSAMAPAPADRYSSMADLVSDLEVYLRMEKPAVLASAHIESFPVAPLISGAYEVGAYRFDAIRNVSSLTAAAAPTPSVATLPHTAAAPAPAERAPRSRSRLMWLGVIAALAAVVCIAAAASMIALAWLDASRSDAPAPPSVSTPRTPGREGIAAPGPTPRPNVPAVHMTSSKSNQNWTITLQVRDRGVKEILYRSGPEGPFQSAGHMEQLDMETGLPLPISWFSLPLSQPRAILFVKLVRADGSVDGPHELLFDPAAEAVRSARQTLSLTSGSWVAFRDFDERRLLYFTHLMSYGDAISEIRYSLDVSTLDRRFDTGSETPYVEVPLTTQVAFVQVVFADGTTSEARRFDAASASLR